MWADRRVRERERERAGERKRERESFPPLLVSPSWFVLLGFQGVIEGAGLLGEGQVGGAGAESGVDSSTVVMTGAAACQSNPAQKARNPSATAKVRLECSSQMVHQGGSGAAEEEGRRRDCLHPPGSATCMIYLIYLIDMICPEITLTRFHFGHHSVVWSLWEIFVRASTECTVCTYVYVYCAGMCLYIFE